MRGSNGGIRICRTFTLVRGLWARHSSTKLFVGGLSYDTNETVLKDAFGLHGEIIEAFLTISDGTWKITSGNHAMLIHDPLTYLAVKVICDHQSGKSKGYGFVQFTSESAASTAMKEMDGQLLDGWNIRVQYAHNQ